MRYRRMLEPGASYFFTVTLADRNSTLLINNIDQLRKAFAYVKEKHPFKIDAVVILPEHLHMIMTLPEAENNYSQ